MITVYKPNISKEKVFSVSHIYLKTKWKTTQAFEKAGLKRIALSSVLEVLL